MKNIKRTIISTCQGARIGAFFLCCGLLGGQPLTAGESSSAGKSVVQPAQEEENFSNWVNLSIGGPIIGGDVAQFKQQEHSTQGVIGGIDDMHYEKTFGKKTVLTIDGHALFDNTDYKAVVSLTQQDLGYIRAGYTLFRTWYDGNGGYLPSASAAYPNGQFFAPANNDLALDRGDVWVELGLRVPNLPEITVRYDHEYRYGQKDSTEWGTAYLNNAYTTSLNRRYVSPTYLDINEKRDIFTLEATKTVFGNTDLGLGMRYEHNSNNDTQNEITGRTATNQTHTVNNNQLELDLFNGHFSSVTRFNDYIWLTLGYSYTSVNSDTGGSRLTYRTGTPPAAPGGTYKNLNGGSVQDQQVINFNLMWVPIKDLTIIPALRVGIENIDSNSPFVSLTNVHSLAVSSNHFNEVEESLDIRYSGIDNILLYLRGNWDERTGDFGQNLTNLATGLPSLDQNANNTYLSQKYAAGINWYPLTNVNVALQYYYLTEQNNYDWGTPTPMITGGNLNAGKNVGVISAEQFNTNDLNARVTWRPFNGLSLVTRYDMQYTKTYNSGIGGPGAPSSAHPPTNPNSYLGETQSAEITNNMFTESITWSPLPRLYIQGNGSYVLSETECPASEITLGSLVSPTVTNFNNDYYELSCDVGFILDDKTDLHASYSYYRACNYQNNVSSGVPYGAGAIENNVSAGIVRKLTKNISLSLTYSYVSYSDQTSGYNNNYTANMIYSGLQFKF
jgi:hypothetical protein